MKLYDIRTALKNLVRINKDLTSDRLHTLLLASGWEEQDIKDALLMWEAHSYEDMNTNSASAEVIVKEDMTPSVETLEDATTIFAETAMVKEEHKEESKKEIGKETKHDVEVLSVKNSQAQNEIIHSSVKIEEPALVITEVKSEVPTKPIVKEEMDSNNTTVVTPPSIFDYVSKQTPHEELPHNLPLRPYESSYVTVPLKEYEKRFATHSAAHVDTMENHKASLTEQRSIQQEVVTTSESKNVKPVFIPSPIPVRIEKLVEAPLETEDKYLAFIAIVLFVLIMFILGYMHIIGRI